MRTISQCLWESEMKTNSVLRRCAQSVLLGVRDAHNQRTLEMLKNIAMLGVQDARNQSVLLRVRDAHNQRSFEVLKIIAFGSPICT